MRRFVYQSIFPWPDKESDFVNPEEGLAQELDGVAWRMLCAAGLAPGYVEFMAADLQTGGVIELPRHAEKLPKGFSFYKRALDGFNSLGDTSGALTDVIFRAPTSEFFTHPPENMIWESIREHKADEWTIFGFTIGGAGAGLFGEFQGTNVSPLTDCQRKETGLTPEVAAYLLKKYAFLPGQKGTVIAGRHYRLHDKKQYAHHEIMEARLYFHALEEELKEQV